MNADIDKLEGLPFSVGGDGRVQSRLNIPRRWAA